jgi:hypothetical protein
VLIIVEVTVLGGAAIIFIILVNYDSIIAAIGAIAWLFVTENVVIGILEIKAGKRKRPRIQNPNWREE